MRLTMKRTETFYVPGDEDKAYIVIRALSSEELARIEAKCSETSTDDKGRAKMILNPYERINGVALACLEDWDNFYDEKNLPLKFSAKTVMKVARLSVMVDGVETRFFDWVDQCHTELRETVQREESAAEKNS